MKRLRLHIAILSAFVFLLTGPGVSFSQGVEENQPTHSYHAFTSYENPFTHFDSGIIQTHLEPELSPFPELYSISDLFDSKSHKTTADSPTLSFVDSSLPISISPDEDETIPQNVLISHTGHNYYSQSPSFPSQPPAKRIALCPMESGVAIGAP